MGLSLFAFLLLLLLVEGFVRVAQLDQASGIVEEDPGIFFTMGMLCQILEIFTSLTDQPEFEHQHSMIESTDKVIRVDQETSHELLNSTREITRKRLLGCLSEVEVWSLTLGEWGS